MSADPLTVVADGPPPAGAATLAALLHPVTPETFRTRYWQRRPLHLTGWGRRLEGLFDRSALRAALERQHEAGLSIRVSSDREGDGGGAGAHRPVDAADVAGHLRAGASVCVDPIDRADPALAAFAATLKRQLGHAGPVNVKCYLSPPGYGFNTHFDAHVVTTLQIEGRKRWRVSAAPGVEFPVDNAFLDAGGVVRYMGRPPSSLRPWETPPVDEGGFAEVLLVPGDVLCLPAGTWHNAKASGGHSLALNVAFPPADPVTLLADAVRSRLADSASWRAGVPAVPADGAELPEEIRAYLGERVDELIEALRTVVTDDLVGRQWSAAVAGGFGAGGTGPARSPAMAGGPGEAGGQVQVVVAVKSAADAARWYERVLGCRVVFTIAEFGWVELATPVPGLTLGLSEQRPAGDGAILNVRVDDLDDTRATLARHGVHTDAPAAGIAGVARFLRAHDPDGNPLMFYQPDGERSR